MGALSVSENHSWCSQTKTFLEVIREQRVTRNQLSEITLEYLPHHKKIMLSTKLVGEELLRMEY